MAERKFAFDTQQLHAGQVPDGDFRARAVPIYQTTSFSFRDFQNARDINTFDSMDYEYTRVGNPTAAVLEARLAALEGGTAALALASGMAAISNAVLNVTAAGDDIVAARNLYGGSYSLFTHTLPKYGVRTTFVDPTRPEAFADAIGAHTKAVFIESIGNPNADLVDVAAIAENAHAAGIPLIVDNTFATPYLFRPFEHGADIVVHSATKYIGGHGTSIGGIIVESGRFDWGNGKFPGFTTPDPIASNIVHWEKWRDYPGIGSFAFVMKARLQFLRDLGAAISPFNAFLLLQGTETLSLRMRQHVANAQRIAEFLHTQPQVDRVNYPGLATDPHHALAKRYFPKGAGAILSFALRGGEGAAKTLLESVKLFSFLANVGDSKSLIVHPATVTHPQLSDAAKVQAGILPGTLRLSIGTEDIDDLLWDLEQAFRALS